VPRSLTRSSANLAARCSQDFFFRTRDIVLYLRQLHCAGCFTSNVSLLLPLAPKTLFAKFSYPFGGLKGVLS